MGKHRVTFGDLAELVRLPAVLSAPGDALLGAAASGGVSGARRVGGLMGASCLIYMGGMALNDFADRDVDAVERPQRPIPSGRVSPTVARRVAQGLLAGGVASAVWGGGVTALPVALSLVGAVSAYDLALKGGAAGPAAMAACRSLNVLLGARPGRRAEAFVPALVVGAHILDITVVSGREVTGGSRRVGAGALAATAAVTVLAGVTSARSLRRRERSAPMRGVASAALLGAFAASVGMAEKAAFDDPSPQSFQRVVGAGILGLLPLEGGMLAAEGPAWAAASLASLWPLSRRLAKKRAIT